MTTRASTMIATPRRCSLASVCGDRLARRRRHAPSHLGHRRTVLFVDRRHHQRGRIRGAAGAPPSVGMDRHQGSARGRRDHHDGGCRLIATWRGAIADERRLNRAGHVDRLAAWARRLNHLGRDRRSVAVPTTRAPSAASQRIVSDAGAPHGPWPTRAPGREANEPRAPDHRCAGAGTDTLAPSVSLTGGRRVPTSLSAGVPPLTRSRAAVRLPYATVS
jgi:hypothetical protein